MPEGEQPETCESLYECHFDWLQSLKNSIAYHLEKRSQPDPGKTASVLVERLVSRIEQVSTFYPPINRYDLNRFDE